MKNNQNNIIINQSKTELNNFYKNKFKVHLNRISFIFIIIFFLIILYSTRIIYLSTKTLKNNNYEINAINRADITDRHGNYISKSVFTTNIGIF